MRIFDALVPFVSSGLAIWAVYTFPITEARAHEIRLELEARRGEPAVEN
jgi:GPH family glycoside/pentoside/hexuronide:cation symporter